MTAGRPCLVAVGGLDPGGGSGLVRDFATAQALAATAILVGTAWTRQDATGVQAIEEREPARVAEALVAALDAARKGPSAVKIGMVASPATAAAVASALDGWQGPVVLDPVLQASSGSRLYRGTPAAMAVLVRRSSVVTPNLAEAAWLAGFEVRSVAEARAAGRAILSAGAAAVLVKGGHLHGAATDLLCTPAGERAFEGARIAGPSPRGTGCALASAIALGLARGEALAQAVGDAKAWLAGRIAAAVAVGGEWQLP